MPADISSPRQVQPPIGTQRSRNPWAWIPTLYLAEALPYVVVMTASVIMYKGLGISNTDIALYTSWLYLPWVIKPLWSPIVDLLKTRRLWIWVMQLIIGAGFAGVALTIPTADVFRYSLAFLALLAFSSATHDIAADGFYMLATTEKEQAFFVGIRSTFYRISTISGQGLLCNPRVQASETRSSLRIWIFCAYQLTDQRLRFYLAFTGDALTDVSIRPRPLRALEGAVHIPGQQEGRLPMRRIIETE